MQAEPIAPQSDQICQHMFKLSQYQSRKLNAAPQPLKPPASSKQPSTALHALALLLAHGTLTGP